jgi:hypothetical protein
LWSNPELPLNKCLVSTLPGPVHDDVDAEVLSITAVSAVVLVNDQVTFTPEANFNGVATFEYTVSDGALIDTGLVTVIVKPVNEDPIALDDNGIATDEDVVATIATAALLANDADPADNDTLSVASVQNALQGVVSLSGNTITFIPETNFNGEASFEYTLSDGQGGFNTAQAALLVNAVNDASCFDAVANQTANEDTASTDLTINNVLAGPANEAAQVVTVTAVSSNAAIVPNPTISGAGTTRTLSFQPVSNAFGAVTITVTVTDDGGTASGGIDTTQRTFTIAVDNVNEAPLVTNDAYTTPIGTPLTVTTAIGVLANDTDFEGSTLTVSEVNGSPTSVATPIGIGTGVLILEADGSFTYASDAGVFEGSFSYTVTDGITSSTGTATITVANRMTQIAAGIFSSCALDIDGAAFCWGSGSLGTDLVSSGTSLMAVSGAGSSDISQISMGAGHSCMLKTDGAVFCFGSNGIGQLGVGNTPITNDNPVAVIGAVSFGVSQISAGNAHTCAVKTDGSAFCWGGNDGIVSGGKLGDGTTTNSSIPVAVIGAGSSGVSQISAGFFHTCAVKTDGSAFCWGDNNFAQLGDGTSTDSSSPVTVLGTGN